MSRTARLRAPASDSVFSVTARHHISFHAAHVYPDAGRIFPVFCLRDFVNEPSGFPSARRPTLEINGLQCDHLAGFYERRQPTCRRFFYRLHTCERSVLADESKSCEHGYSRQVLLAGTATHSPAL